MSTCAHAAQAKRLTPKRSSRGANKLVPYPVDRPRNNPNAEELFNKLPPIHQQPEQQLSLGKVKILAEQMLKGKRYNQSNTSTTAQAMSEWTPTADRVTGVTDRSAWAFSLGNIAGTWFSPAQMYTLRLYAASHPCWVATSIAGRFYQDHLMQAPKKPYEKPKLTATWLKAKAEAHDLTGSQWTSVYSEDESSTLTAAERTSLWPASTYWCATLPTLDCPATARACASRQLASQREHTRVSTPHTARHTRKCPTSVVRIIGHTRVILRPCWPTPRSELSADQRNHCVHLGFDSNPTGPNGWHTHHQQGTLPPVFAKETHSKLTDAQKDALSKLRISAKGFEQHGTQGILPRYLRQWRILAKRDKEHAHTLGYADRADKRTNWGRNSIEWDSDTAGKVSAVSEHYGLITSHNVSWEKLPTHSKTAATALDWTPEVQPQLPTAGTHRHHTHGA